MRGKHSRSRNSSVFVRAKNRYDGWSRWAQITAVAGPVAVLGMSAGGAFSIVLNGGSDSARASSVEHFSLPSGTSSLSSLAASSAGRGGLPSAAPGPSSPAASAAGQHVLPSAPSSPSSAAASSASPVASSAEPSGIPSADLGTWGGQITLVAGITDHFSLSLSTPGSPGSSVGAFTNQTGHCYGNVLLGGVSGGRVVDLRLVTTEDPDHGCPASMEADVQLAQGGAALDYEVVAVDTVHSAPQNPLAEGSLFR